MKRRKGEWCVDELKDNNNEYDPDFIYVKLAENRESYTAYNGSNVWQAIYEENCMLDRIQSSGSNPLDKIEQCSEVTLLYQVVSGLHASVNMHVTSNYQEPGSAADATPYANHTMYYNSIGAHTDRLKNLHFVYALTVRALNLVYEQLIDHDYMSGMCSKKDA